jgi:hypothetical protein
MPPRRGLAASLSASSPGWTLLRRSSTRNRPRLCNPAERRSAQQRRRNGCRRELALARSLQSRALVGVQSRTLSRGVRAISWARLRPSRTACMCSATARSASALPPPSTAVCCNRVGRFRPCCAGLAAEALARRGRLTMVAKYLLAVLAIVFLAAALLSLLRHGFPVRPAGRACFLPAGHLLRLGVALASLGSRSAPRADGQCFPAMTFVCCGRSPRGSTEGPAAPPGRTTGRVSVTFVH